MTVNSIYYLYVGNVSILYQQGICILA